MDSSMLHKRRLGRTEVQVTALGLGGAHLGRTADGFRDELAVATVHRALELGINLVDTSPMYGDSERRVGLALAEWYRRGGRREDIILSTKSGHDDKGNKDFSADGTRRSVERSLRRLRTDYIDILLVHDPDDLESVFQRGGALEALQQLKDEGVIRAIGLGARPHEFHRRCIASGAFDVVLTFCDYNLLDQSAAAGVLEPAVAQDVGVLNGAAIMLGLLGGEDPRVVAPRLGAFATRQRVERATQLWEWARDSGISLLALNLQFCLREPRIAATLVGARNPAEVQADVQAVNDQLPQATWEQLRARFGLG